ncbi:hypothetical protein BD413DRAFT_199302 [Trametes elegans]|nr:hypothetical protein BD413DRAFT_199302 [Trametes elegans]
MRWQVPTLLRRSFHRSSGLEHLLVHAILPYKDYRSVLIWMFQNILPHIEWKSATPSFAPILKAVRLVGRQLLPHIYAPFKFARSRRWHTPTSAYNNFSTYRADVAHRAYFPRQWHSDHATRGARELHLSGVLPRRPPLVHCALSFSLVPRETCIRPR